MAVALLNHGTMGQSATGSVSAAFSVTNSGANRCAFAVVAWDKAASLSVTSITYGGQTMTSCGIAGLSTTGGSHFCYCQIFYLVNPPTGSNTLAITVAGGTVTDVYYNLVAFTGVNQATPVRAGTYQSSTAAAGVVADGLTITSNVNDLTITVVNGEGLGVVTSNQTSDTTNTVGSYGSGSDHATTAATSVTHTYTGLTAADGSIVGFSIDGDPSGTVVGAPNLVPVQPVPFRPAVGGLGGFDAPELQTWQSNANPVSNIVPIVATYAQQPPQLAIPMLPTAGGFVLGTPPQQSNAAPVAQAIVASLTPPPLVMDIPMRRGVTRFTIGLPPRGDTSAPVPNAVTVSGTVPYPQNLIPMHRGPNGLFARGKPPQGATNSVAPTPPPPPTGNGGGIINRRRRR